MENNYPKTNIEHMRIPKDMGYLYTSGRTTYDDVMNLFEMTPYPKGGITEITVEFELGVVAKGVARCSHKENYNKEKGRSIALGRLLRNFKDNSQKVNEIAGMFARDGVKFDWWLVRRAYEGRKIP